MSYENPIDIPKNNLDETCYCPKDCTETIYFPEVSYVPSVVTTPGYSKTSMYIAST
jgi:hypothetical protein